MSIVYLRLNELPIIIYAGPFIVWLIFFWLGVYLSKFSNNYQIKYIIIGIMVSIIFMFFESEFIHYNQGGGYGIKPSSFLFSILMILVLFSKKTEKCFSKDNYIKRWLVKLGNYSFPIYLTHYFIVDILYSINPNLCWFMRWLSVVGVSVLFIYIMRKLLPHKGIKLMGF